MEILFKVNVKNMERYKMKMISIDTYFIYYLSINDILNNHFLTTVISFILYF